ncbi:hypothetical protein Pcac1_g780 [Phytophthora cactorum]|nr:hypothetical protein Pcac1_g28344 [Phytophthora cactorum]KAG2790964.1 hypothetical protein Pcac1_g780 [Phytophthora cactorum]
MSRLQPGLRPGPPLLSLPAALVALGVLVVLAALAVVGESAGPVPWASR